MTRINQNETDIFVLHPSGTKLKITTQIASYSSGTYETTYSSLEILLSGD